jgi:hypothetical protein
MTPMKNGNKFYLSERFALRKLMEPGIFCLDIHFPDFQKNGSNCEKVLAIFQERVKSGRIGSAIS